MTASSLQTLRVRIRWACFGIRAAAVGYAAWGILGAALFWSDSDRVERAFRFWFEGQSPLNDPLHRTLAFGLSFAVWMLVVAAVMAAWKLTQHYLAGQVFTVDAALALKRVGTFGLLATGADVLIRPVLHALLSPGPAIGMSFLQQWIRPNDLLFACVFIAFWAIAHVLESAALLSDEVERFV